MLGGSKCMKKAGLALVNAGEFRTWAGINGGKYPD
jgi:hypothetical protein